MTKRSNVGRRKGFMDLYLHTKSACSTRYGHTLSEEEFVLMGEMVRRREGVMVLKQSGSRSIWLLTLPFGQVYVVYNRELSLPCTVLEKYMVDGMVRDAHSSYEEAA